MSPKTLPAQFVGMEDLFALVNKKITNRIKEFSDTHDDWLKETMVHSWYNGRYPNKKSRDPVALSTCRTNLVIGKSEKTEFTIKDKADESSVKNGARAENNIPHDHAHAVN